MPSWLILNHSLACAFLSRLFSSRTVCEPFSRFGQQQWRRRQQEGSLRETAAAYKCQIYPGFLAATMEHTCSMSTINPLTFCPSLRELTCPNDVSSVYYLKTSYVHALERRRRRFSGGDCDFHFLCRCQIPAFPFPSSP